MDIKLPDMSGFDVLHGIRKARPTTKVILITGHATLATAIQAINGLAFAYLVKPFEMSHLLVTVEQAVRKQRLTQALWSPRSVTARDREHRRRGVSPRAGRPDRLGNHRAEIITGTPQAELVGRSISPCCRRQGPGKPRPD